MQTRRIRAWSQVHRWSGLICTAFLLIICVTGLPLIFVREINDAAQPAREPARVVAGATRAVSIDRLIAACRARFPAQPIVSVSLDDDEPVAFVTLAPSFAAAKADYRVYHWLKFDMRTGEVINTSEQFERDVKADSASSVIDRLMIVMLRLHVDLFAGLAGRLLLCAMGLLFVTAIVSGVVLYGPFTRKLDFGEVRVARSRRTRWLDLHNLLGIVTMLWALVVGVTGAMNDVAGPLYQHWSNGDVKAIWEPWRDQTPPRQSEMASVQAAFDATRRALPEMKVTSLMFPDPNDDRPYHYWLWVSGKTHLTERLSTVVLIDARTGKLTSILDMPWYLRALEISRPLHFGDYGGLPLKIIWALLDLVTIVVLGSGLYLWAARPRREKAAAARQALHGTSRAVGPAE